VRSGNSPIAYRKLYPVFGFGKLAQIRDPVELRFAHSPAGDSPFSSRLPVKTAIHESTLGRQELVSLAREISGSAVEVIGGANFSGSALKLPEMATTEENGAAAQPESPTARFTAVNGKDQSTATGQTSAVNGNGASRRGSDERSNGQPRISPPGQEKLTITTTTTSQREDWIPPANGDRQPYQPTAYSDAEGSHKRKRSGSIDQNSSSANSYHSHALPSSTKQTPTTATTESDVPREEALRAPSHSDHRDSYAPEVQYQQFLASSKDNRETAPRSDSWHARQYPQQPHMSSDEHIGEVLQRASQNMDAHQRDYNTSPQDDGSAGPYSAYPNDRREMSAQSDPKKRKRNFSNRTKTGCMTCRRRKKKCDENRPECE
jgi:hypothetical protein